MATIATELIETKRDERGRRIRRRDERAALVQAYEASGMTQRAFAEREGIKYPTLVSWIQEVRRGGSRAKVGFTELTLGRPPAPLEVQLPDGSVIRGSQAEDVARLLQLIRC